MIGWTPTKERQPDEPGQYITTEVGGIVVPWIWDGEIWTTAAYPGLDVTDRVIAWMPLPEPYEQRSETE